MNKILFLLILPALFSHSAAQTYSDDSLIVARFLYFNPGISSSVKYISDSSGGRITHLDASDSNLDTLIIPPEMVNLTGLTCLDLSKNRLTNLPAEIGDLTYLDSLVISDNDLTSIPPEIGNLTELTYLKLNDNDLVGIPLRGLQI